MRGIVIFICVLFLGLKLHANDTAYYELLKKDTLEVGVFYNDAVKSKIISLKQGSWLTNKTLGKYSTYRKEIEDAFVKNGLPKELAIMCISNTQFEPLFVGKEDGAVGIWPLSFSMAKRYNLQINSYIDQRRSIELSTEAAIRFTKELYTIYQDWKLVITAFRVGAIKVNLAIRKANNVIDYSQIYPYLDYESKEVMENFMAWYYIANHYKGTYKFEPKAELDTFLVSEDVMISLFSNYTGITEAKVKELNPVIKKNIIPGKQTPFYLNVPQGEKESIVKLIPFLADSTKNYLYPPKPAYVAPVKSSGGSTTGTSGKKLLYYTVKSGDNLGLIADCYDVMISDVKRWNGIRGTTIYAGKKLKIYVPSSKYSRYKLVNGYSMSKKRSVAASD